MKAAATQVTPAQRLEAAREAKLAVDAVLESAHATLAQADAGGDAAAVRKAEDAVADAKRASDRYGRSLAHAERQLEEWRTAQAAEALAEQRAAFRGLLSARDKAGKTIAAALDMIAAGVAELDAADAALIALPESIRGTNAVPGHNLGSSALRAHLSVELSRRGIVGEPSSMPVPTLAEWLVLGSRTLSQELGE